MNLNVLTLGERMVMIARIAAAEHIRRAAKDEGVEIAQISRLIQDAKLSPESNFRGQPEDAGRANVGAAMQRGPGEAA